MFSPPIQPPLILLSSMSGKMTSILPTFLQQAACPTARDLLVNRSWWQYAGILSKDLSNSLFISLSSAYKKEGKPLTQSSLKSNTIPLTVYTHHKVSPSVLTIKLSWCSREWMKFIGLQEHCMTPCATDTKWLNFIIQLLWTINNYYYYIQATSLIQFIKLMSCRSKFIYRKLPNKYVLYVPLSGHLYFLVRHRHNWIIIYFCLFTLSAIKQPRPKFTM